MDRFEKIAVTMAIVALAVYVGLAFWGMSMGYELGGTDATVEKNAVDASGGSAFESPNSVIFIYLPFLELSEEYEPLGFTIVGIAAGLCFGYIWPRVFKEDGSG